MTHSRRQGYKLATIPSAKLKMKCVLLLKSTIVPAMIKSKD